ncbi:DUF3106 domain-containing protein [Ramlibacter ginsenosidimutans]|nr:DUF3106 domain-containing protein [Ramlibacter ginsenosidimutans]
MTAMRLAFLKPGLLALGLAVGATWAMAQTAGAPAGAPVVAPQPAQSSKPSVSTKAPIHAAPVRSAPPARAEAKPTWVELTPPQQQALAPLAATWRTLGEAHKRKWLALSENFSTMPPPEQDRLHSRMTEWAALSPQQRNAARLNYAEARKVAPSEKRAKWEAYQALPPEEKRRLAGTAAAKPTPPSTAIAVRPVPQQQLAKVPKSKKAEGGAKIAVIPGQVDNNTLLPQPLAPLHP